MSREQILLSIRAVEGNYPLPDRGKDSLLDNTPGGEIQDAMAKTVPLHELRIYEDQVLPVEQ
jgi:hypothetical protein